MPEPLVSLDRQKPLMHNAYVLGLLSHAAYAASPAEHVSFRKTAFNDCARFFSRKTGADGFVTSDAENVVVAFRGTEEPLDAVTDASLALTDTEFGRVHAGFWKSVESVWNHVIKHVERRRTNEQTLWITGHSLGAAMASIAALRLSTTIPPFQVVTFGQPRTGGASFAKKLRAARIRQFRFVNNDDIVPTIPPRAIPLGIPPEFYEHVGDLHFFDADGKLHDQPDGELGVLSALLSAVNSVSGNDAEARRIVTRGIRDHAMERYVDRLEANRP